MVTIVKKSNVRLLTKTLAVVSLLVPASGYTLGIGEIKLHSALNQNLDAEISLTLSGESLSDIKVNLAAPEKFDAAGVPWTYFLSKIKFEPITRSNGAAIIKLTSKEALKEPFLDFLLEVSWPKGNLYREFTVLVDPPSVYNQATIPVSTGTESHAQQSTATPLSHANGQSSDGEYGPTLSNDTLWSVAEHVRGQHDISVEQMMIALYEANPQAFYKENVYALMTGKTLKIPDRATVLKLSRHQALATFNQHKKAWKNYSAPTHVETAKEKAVPDKAEKPALTRNEEPADNQLKLEAPSVAAIEGSTVVAPANEPVSTEKQAPVTLEVTKDKVGLTPEAGVTEGLEKDAGGTVPTDSAIQNKVAELEKQLAMMQELITLKDQQLAALQKQPQANPVVQQQAPPDAVVLAKPVEQAAPAPQHAVVQSVPPVAQPKTETGYYLGIGGAGAAALALLGWLWWRKRKIDEETNTESMFASSIVIKPSEADENLLVPVIEEGAIHDVNTVGESSFLSEFTPSDFDSFDTDQGEIDPISEADVYLAYGRYQQAEELIRQAIKDQPNRDECKLKLLEVFYANENQTAFEAYSNELAEAGKRNEAEFWEKAAEMGREICPESPLFSFGDTTFNKESANIEAVSFEDAVSDSFVGETLESNDFNATSSDVENGSFQDEQRNNEDIDFDLSSFSMDTRDQDEADKGVIASNTVLDKSSGTRTNDIDFELSSFSMESDEADKGVIASNIVLGNSSGVRANDIDFELSSFSMDAKQTNEQDNDFVTTDILSEIPLETPVTDKNQEFESYPFDFSSKNVDTKEIDDLDFNALGSDDKDYQDIDFSVDESLELDDDFDFNFDLDTISTTDKQNVGQYDEFGVSDLTDMDELETKLDLAKAYVDMGDADAAKDIAREVLEQGTDEQKKIAQALLDELS